MSAVGVARIVAADCVKPGAAVVDVGISRTEAGIVGDVDFDAVREVAGLGHADARWHRPDDRRLPAREHPRRGAPAGRAGVIGLVRPLASARRGGPTGRLHDGGVMDLEQVKAEGARLSPWAHLATVGADGQPDVVPIHPAGRATRSG